MNKIIYFRWVLKADHDYVVFQTILKKRVLNVGHSSCGAAVELWAGLLLRRNTAPPSSPCLFFYKKKMNANIDIFLL